MPDNSNGGREELYIAVSPMLIRPWASGRFSVYLRHEGSYVLYTKKGQAFTKEHREKLSQLNPSAVFIPKGDKADYEYYLRENLGTILLDESIPVDVRSRAWYQASVSLVQSVFEEKLPKAMKRHRFSQVKGLVRESLQFFTNQGAVKDIIKLVSRGYQTYNHALSTMVLTSFLMQDHEDTDEELLVKVGVGAILHDMGKAGLPEEVLAKPQEKMSGEERELFRSHPSLGVGLCMQLPLSVETHHCILFHHERENGMGYPSGLIGESMPYYLKALILANEYDQLTRATAWRPSYRPFDALQRIEHRLEQFDAEMFKKLIRVLSAADVIEQE